MYVYIYMPSVRPVVSRRRRRPLLCLSVRPVVRPAIVVRLLSVRPRLSSLRRRLSYVRPLSVLCPVLRLIITYTMKSAALQTNQ